MQAEWNLSIMPASCTGLARRIRDYPTLNLVLGGTEDILWWPGFRGTGRVLELGGADHALEVADRDMSDLLHESVAPAVGDFASRVSASTSPSRPS